MSIQITPPLTARQKNLALLALMIITAAIFLTGVWSEREATKAQQVWIAGRAK